MQFYEAVWEHLSDAEKADIVQVCDEKLIGVLLEAGLRNVSSKATGCFFIQKGEVIKCLI